MVSKSAGGGSGGGKAATTGKTRGWAMVAEFGKGGKRWSGRGARLKVVGVHIERGTGAKPADRAALLRRAIDAEPPDGATVYFTTAGFFGMDPQAGASSSRGDIDWTGVAPKTVQRHLGGIASALPATARLLVGADFGEGYYDEQEQWLFEGTNERPVRRVVRNQMPVGDRVFDVGGFRVLSFVCGEISDGRARLRPERHLSGIDAVIDLAHASVPRTHDRHASWHKASFQTRFQWISEHAGAALAHAHDDDDLLVRCRNNWVVYRDEDPFPEDVVVHRI